MALKSTKSKRRPFDYKKKEILSKGRNQAPLKVPDTSKVRTGSAPKFRRRNQSDAIADFGKAIAGAAGKKKKMKKTKSKKRICLRGQGAALRGF